MPGYIHPNACECQEISGVARHNTNSIRRSFLDYVDDIRQYADRTSDATNYKSALTAFNTFIDSLSVNDILGVKPAPIADVAKPE